MSDIIGPIIGAIGGVVGGGINAATQASINSQNLQFQQQNLDYQKQLQQQEFAREDDAVQRRVADLKAAGLSPTLAAGSAASAGPVVQTSAPQIGPAPNFGAIPSDAIDGASAAISLALQSAQVDKVKADTALVDQQRNQLTQMTPLTVQAQKLSNDLAADINPLHVTQAQLDVASTTLANELSQGTLQAKIDSASVALRSGQLANINADLDSQMRSLQISDQAYQNVRDQVAANVAQGTQQSSIDSAALDVVAKQASINAAKALLPGQEAASSMASQSAGFYKSIGLSPAFYDRVNEALRTVTGFIPFAGGGK